MLRALKAKKSAAADNRWCLNTAWRPLQKAAADKEVSAALYALYCLGEQKSELWTSERMFLKEGYIKADRKTDRPNINMHKQAGALSGAFAGDIFGGLLFHPAPVYKAVDVVCKKGGQKHRDGIILHLP